MSVKIEDNSKRVIAILRNRAVYTLRLFADDVKKESTPKTPKKEGDLRKLVLISSKAHANGAKATILWDRKYAQYQERGMRKDGSHKVRNYTTPGTGPHYAENAVKKKIKHFSKYVEQAANLIK